MKTNKKILSAVLASTTMLNALSSYVAVAETTPGTLEQTARVVEIGEGKDNTTFPQTLEENTTYKLTSDITIADTLTISAKNVTIDLNGHTLTVAQTKTGIMVNNNCSLTVNDTSDDKAGVIKRADKSSNYMVQIGAAGSTSPSVAAEFIMNGGTIEHSTEKTAYAIACRSGKMTLNGGHVVVEEGQGCITVWEDSKFNELVMTGGKITGPTVVIQNPNDHFEFAGDDNKGHSVAVLNNMKTTITGGEIEGIVWAGSTGGYADTTPPTVNIDGDVKITGTLQIGRNAGNGATLPAIMKITGGEFTGNIRWSTAADNVSNLTSDGNLTISGGKVTVNKFYLPEVGENANDFKATQIMINTEKCDFTNNDTDNASKITKVENPSVTNLEVVEGNDAPETMLNNNDEIERYNKNKGLYEFSALNETADGYEMTVKAKLGEMEGEPAAGSPGKNVLFVFKMDKTFDFDIQNKNGLSLFGDGDPLHWKADGHYFVDDADTDNKDYATVWVTLTDALMGKSSTLKVVSTNALGETAEKKLKITFEDITEYTCTVDENGTFTDYTPTAVMEADGKNVKITLTPNSGKSFTAVPTLKLGDDTTKPLTLSGNAYTVTVPVKDLISADNKKLGKVEVKLTSADFAVETATMSETIKAVDMTVGIEAPSTMTDPDELTRYQDNRNLYTANDIVWYETSRTATVKVPAELMKNNTSINSGNGQGAANVCLILKLETALESDDDGKYSTNFDGTAIEEADVTDGYMFVDGATEADKGKYVVLWINAGATALASGTKTVVYKTAGGDVIATVNLVKIPGVKEAPAEQTTAITTITEDAIITQARTNLGIINNLDELDFTVGTLPTATGDSDVIVTVKAKSGSECVLVEENGNVVTEMATKVKVNIAADAKAVVTFGTPTNGTFTAKVDGTKIVTGAEVAVGTEITLTASPAGSYNFSSWSVTDAAGNSVTVSSNKFTMPAGGVTINATFTAKPTSPSRPSTGGSYGGGGSYSSGSTSIYIPYATISNDKNAVNEEVKVTAKPGAPVADEKSGITVKTEENEKAAKDSSVKISAPENTFKLTDLAEEVLKNTPGSQLTETKKSVEEGVKAVAAGKGFALNVKITKDGKNVEPDRNVEMTIPVPEAFKGKKLYVYRLTERGAVPVLARVANNKVTAFAGGSGTFIFTTEKLENAPIYKKGSVDLDGATTAKDATLVLKHIVELNTLKDEKLFMADVNGDGYVNAKDATEILKMVVSLA